MRQRSHRSRERPPAAVRGRRPGTRAPRLAVEIEGAVIDQVRGVLRDPSADAAGPRYRRIYFERPAIGSGDHHNIEPRAPALEGKSNNRLPNNRRHHSAQTNNI
jgi:hypothetical protein